MKRAYQTQIIKRTGTLLKFGVSDDVQPQSRDLTVTFTRNGRTRSVHVEPYIQILPSSVNIDFKGWIPTILPEGVVTGRMSILGTVVSVPLLIKNIIVDDRIITFVCLKDGKFANMK